MSNWYCSSVAHTAVAQFAISHAYVIGDIVRQLAAPAVGSERCFRCTTAGTSGGSESAWTLTKSATTTQGTAIFTEVTGNETYQAAGAWAAPFARIISAGASGWCVAGDTIYVAANHAETTGSAVSWAIQSGISGSAQTNIICVDQSGSGHVPPASGDIRATASFTITGNFALTLGGGNIYVYGIAFNLQSGGSNNQSHTLGTTFASTQRFEACAFNLLSSANSSLSMNTAAGGVIEWINTTISFGNNAVAVTPRGKFIWRDTASAFSGTAPATVFLTDNANFLNVYFDGVDLSGLGAAKVILISSVGGRFQAVNCKLSASMALPTLGGTNYFDTRIDFINCDSAGSTVRSESHSGELTLTTETALVHTSGASDGATAYSWKCLTYSNVKWQQFATTFPIAIWNAATGSSKTVSFEAIVNAAAVLNNDQLWMDVQYLGTASSALVSLASSSKANFLATATAVTASTQAWDSLATARANSNAYVTIGTAIKVASNPGRVFFLTTVGTSSGSEPGGYATAVDGGSVTDGTAVFRAGCRMTVSLTLTPQVAGLIRATPKLGVASTTCYIDPLLTVT